MRRRHLLGAAAGLAALSLPGCGGGGDAAAPPDNFPHAGATAWQRDLDELLAVLQARHPRPWAHCEQSVFMAAAQTLRAALPAQGEAQSYLGLMKLFARLADGHTLMGFPYTRTAHATALPLVVEAFDEGLFVIGTDAAQLDLAGAEVLAYGPRPAAEALALAASYWPTENALGVLDRGAFVLRSSLVLADAGLSPAADRATLTLRTRAGQTVQRELPSADWVSLTPAFSGEPSRRHRSPALDFWFEWLAEAPGALYLRYKRCQNASSFDLLVRQIVTAPAWAGVQRVVVDLRGNAGGDSRVLRSFIQELRGAGWPARGGGLAVLSNRGTYSAAIEGLLELKALGARHIGEAPGQRPNFMANMSAYTSAALQLPFNHATLYYDRVPGDPDRLEPESPVAARVQDWMLNRDPALEAALSS